MNPGTESYPVYCPLFRPGHSQQNAPWIWSIAVTDKNCKVCLGYSRALVTQGHPPSRNAVTTTAMPRHTYRAGRGQVLKTDPLFILVYLPMLPVII